MDSHGEPARPPKTLIWRDNIVTSHYDFVVCVKWPLIPYGISSLNRQQRMKGHRVCSFAVCLPILASPLNLCTGIGWGYVHRKCKKFSLLPSHSSDALSLFTYIPWAQHQPEASQPVELCAIRIAKSWRYSCTSVILQFWWPFTASYGHTRTRDGCFRILVVK